MNVVFDIARSDSAGVAFTSTESQVPQARLCGLARVVEIKNPHAVTVKELDSADLEGVRRVLLKTRNSDVASESSFHPDAVFIAPDAACWLADRHFEVVGVDYFSVEAYTADEPPAHRTMRDAGIVIVEGLNLKVPPPGDYELRIEGYPQPGPRVVLSSLVEGSL